MKIINNSCSVEIWFQVVWWVSWGVPALAKSIQILYVLFGIHTNRVTLHSDSFANCSFLFSLFCSCILNVRTLSWFMWQTRRMVEPMRKMVGGQGCSWWPGVARNNCPKVEIWGLRLGCSYRVTTQIIAYSISTNCTLDTEHIIQLQNQLNIHDRSLR